MNTPTPEPGSVRITPSGEAVRLSNPTPEQVIRDALGSYPMHTHPRDAEALAALDTLIAERDRYREALEQIADPEVFDAGWRSMRKAADAALNPTEEQVDWDGDIPNDVPLTSEGYVRNDPTEEQG